MGTCPRCNGSGVAMVGTIIREPGPCPVCMAPSGTETDVVTLHARIAFLTDTAELQAEAVIQLERDVADITAQRDRLLDRVQSLGEVPCVKAWARTPMKCFPKDPCSFCRCRSLLETLAKETK